MVNVNVNVNVDVDVDVNINADAEYADMPLLEYDGQPIPILEWDINNKGRECSDCDATTNVSELLVLWLVTPAHLAYCRIYFCPDCRKHATLHARTSPGFDVSSYVAQIEDFHMDPRKYA